MPVAPEVQSWVDELIKAGATAEDLQGLLTKAEANAAIANALKGSVMAQSDYSRRMQEIQTTSKKAQDEVAKTTAFYQQLAAWKQNEADPVVQRARQDAESARNDANRIRQRMETLKQSGILSDSDLSDLGPSASTTPVAERPRDPETGKFITVEDFQKQAGEFGRNMPLVSGKLLKLQNRHNKLYAGVKDAPEFDPEALIQSAYDSGKTLEAQAEDLYKFTERDNTIREADIEARIEARAKEKASKYISEAAITGQSSVTRMPGQRIPALDIGAQPTSTAPNGSSAQPSAPAASQSPSSKHERVERFSQKLNEELYGGRV